MAERTHRATKACAVWLAECLRLGWNRDHLDALEALWWEHHDERGNLKPAPGVAPSQRRSAMSYRLLDRGETMQEGDEALADPKLETWEPIPHWSIGMPYRPSNNPVRRALDVSLDAESVIERLQARIEYSAYFNGVRFARLWHWAHEELSETLKSRFFCIVANGTADHMEQPTYAQQMNALRHRAEQAEAELEKQRAAHGVPPSAQCWCHTCRPLGFDRMEMVLCPDCGNKRCPKANDHRNACTGSNEPGQKGSAYETAPFGKGACDKPLAGWWCSRPAGHEGPCAAYPVGGTVDQSPRDPRDEEEQRAARTEGR